MKVGMDVKYGQSYAMAEGLLFKSLKDALGHCAEPWNYPPLYDPAYDAEESETHGRSFWPCHGDWEPDDTVAVIYFGGYGAEYPDRIVTVGPRGGLRLERC